MKEKWDEMSYNRFPTFTSQFQRTNYEEQQKCFDIYEEIFDETEEQEDTECLAWKNRFMCTQ